MNFWQRFIIPSAVGWSPPTEFGELDKRSYNFTKLLCKDAPESSLGGEDCNE